MNHIQKQFFAIIVGSICGFIVFAVLEKAYGQSTPEQQYCNTLAGYAEALAIDRDNGTLEHQALEVAAQEPIPHLRSDYVLLVQLVHNPPHRAPIKEAGLAFELCWATYGGR